MYYHLDCMIDIQNGCTPLCAACSEGHLEVAVTLLERFGADVAAADEVSNESSYRISADISMMNV